MRKGSRIAFGGLAMVLGMIAAQASATSTAGWNQADRSAATIREFQTRLMVAALRCRAAGIDVLGSYNRFIAADRAELAAANDRLKAHFKSASPANGDRDYDRYTTSLANDSATAQWSPASCDEAARSAQQAAAARGNLLAVASADTQMADAPSSPWAAYDRGSEAAPDQSSPRDYARASLPSDDRWQAPAGYDDQGPRRGYDDHSPSWRERDDWRSQQAYNDQSPPPGYGYDDQPPARRYEDRGPPSGYYDDAPAPRGYDGY